MEIEILKKETTAQMINIILQMFFPIISCLLVIPLGSCLQNNHTEDNPYSSSQAISISNAPQLFLDDSLIAKTSNLKRVIQRPKKHPANPIIVQDTPWEQRYLQMYGTVLYDEEINHFRAWYMASESEEKTPETYICYAESLDGVHWIKPTVGTITLPGHSRHNAVLAGAHGLCVRKDREESDPAKRYKGLGGEVLAFSPDGIHWTTETFQSAGQNDTSSSVVWWNGEYLAFIRNQERFRGSYREYTRLDSKKKPFLNDTIRQIAFTASPDFLTWTPKETIFTTDLQDGYPWTQPYGLAVTPYGDQLIGLVWFLHLDHVLKNNKQGTLNIQLVTSRDGRRWTRVADRAVFLESSTANWDRGRVYPSTSLVLKNDQIYIYYSGSDTRHGEDWGKMGIGLATLPADRFVALTLQDESTEGILETRPLHIKGKNLIVNAEISENDLQAELIDVEGNVIAGFGRRNTRLIQHDSLRYRIVWERNGESKTLPDAPLNYPLSIRFYLKKGSLFAFQSEPLDENTPTLKPNNPWSDYRTQYERDRVTLSQAIKTNPNQASLYFERGKLHAQAGNRTLAIEDYSRCIELDPSNAEACFERGKHHFFLTQVTPAHKDFAKTIALDPFHTDAYSWFGLFFHATHSDDQALQILSEGINRLPDNAILYCDRAYIYLRMNQYENALLDYNRAIELNPADYDFYFERGVTYYYLGNLQSAVQDFTKALALRPNDDWALYNRGVMYALLQQPKHAIEDLTSAIAQNPFHVSAFETRGALYADMGNYGRSIQDFNQALQLDPGNPVYTTLLGQSHLENKNYTTAIEILSPIIQHDPISIHYSLARAYSLRAVTHQEETTQRRDIASALDHLEQSVKAGLKDWKQRCARPEFIVLQKEERFQKLVQDNE